MPLFEKIADKIVRYPKHIIVLWIAILVVASPFAFTVLTEPDKALSYEIGGDKTRNESALGNEILKDTNYFSNGDSAPDMMLVIEYPGSDTTKAEELTQRFSERIASEYGHEVANAMALGKQSNGGDKGVYLVSINFVKDGAASKEVEKIRGIVKEVNTDGLQTYVTGSAAIYHDTEASAMKDVKRIDPFSVLLVLILIGLFFRSVVSATMSPMVIGVAYATTLMAILALAQFMSVYYITSTLVLVTMLGAGCDYCIFIMARYREERKKGLEHLDALRESVTWAGESITISGAAVIIGFGTMSICSYEMVSTMGIVMALGIIFALLAALTFIPSIIAVIGQKIFWPSKAETYEEGSKAMRGWYGKFSRAGHTYFAKSSKFAIKHAGAILAVAILVTAPLAYVAVTEKASYDSIAVMSDSESKRGVNSIVENAQGGVIMPTYVVSDSPNQFADIREQHISNEEIASFSPPLAQRFPNGITIGAVDWMTNAPLYRGYAKTLADNIGGDESVGSASFLISWVDLSDAEKAAVKQGLPPQVVEALGLIEGPLWPLIQGYLALNGFNVTRDQAIDYILNYMMGSLSRFSDGHQYIRTTVLFKEIPTSDHALKAVERIRGITADTVSATNTAAGSTVVTTTYVTGASAVIYDVSSIVNNEFYMIEILVMILIFILLFFVMKSYLTPLRAILTIVMSVVWTLGLTFILFTWILGIPVNWIVPIILFVVCLGLGMDYDILLTTRIRENVTKGMDNDSAITSAVESTGAVITICGIIMSSAFGTMVLSSTPMLQQFGFALWFAILVDALLVRTYLVPAVMHLLGRWNWVGPKWLQKGEYDHIHEEVQ